MYGSFSRGSGATEHSRLSSQAFNDPTNAFGVKLCGACDENLAVFAGNVGNDSAVGTQGRANLRDDQSATTKACGDCRAVETGGATAANNRGFGRVDPLIDGDVGDGLNHVFGPNLHHSASRSFKRHTKRTGNVALDRLDRGAVVELDAAAQEKFRIDVAKHEGCIRHGRIAASNAVAGWPRHCARAARSDAQNPAMLDRRDAAAASADALDIHRRKTGQIALERTAKPRFMRERYMTIAH